MTDPNPQLSENPNPSSSNKVPIGSSGTGFPGGTRFPNPPDTANPDPATLREQWKFAIRQYSRWYSHAWGTAILAGVSFFALGWIIKGSNPLPSFRSENPQKNDDKDSPNVSPSSGVDEGGPNKVEMKWKSHFEHDIYVLACSNLEPECHAKFLTYRCKHIEIMTAVPQFWL